MDNLNLPAFEPKIREQNGLLSIFDPIRKKWVKNTPEEKACHRQG